MQRLLSTFEPAHFTFEPAATEYIVDEFKSTLVAWLDFYIVGMGSMIKNTKFVGSIDGAERKFKLLILWGKSFIVFANQA